MKAVGLEADAVYGHWLQNVINKKMKETKFCLGLIDQGHYIGDDPVGHSCCNLAEHELTVQGYDLHTGEDTTAPTQLCAQCYALLCNEPERLTVYAGATALVSQPKIKE
jgi:hypothetical protein